jgi:hypothetical protein
MGACSSERQIREVCGELQTATPGRSFRQRPGDWAGYGCQPLILSERWHSMDLVSSPTPSGTTILKKRRPSLECKSRCAMELQTTCRFQIPAVDAVVSTLVLCCVADQRRSIQENASVEAWRKARLFRARGRNRAEPGCVGSRIGSPQFGNAWETGAIPIVKRGSN